MDLSIKQLTLFSRTALHLLEPSTAVWWCLAGVVAMGVIKVDGKHCTDVLVLDSEVIEDDEDNEDIAWWDVGEYLVLVGEEMPKAVDFTAKGFEEDTAFFGGELRSSADWSGGKILKSNNKKQFHDKIMEIQIKKKKEEKRKQEWTKTNKNKQTNKQTNKHKKQEYLPGKYSFSKQLL